MPLASATRLPAHGLEAKPPSVSAGRVVVGTGSGRDGGRRNESISG